VPALHPTQYRLLLLLPLLLLLLLPLLPLLLLPLLPLPVPVGRARGGGHSRGTQSPAPRGGRGLEGWLPASQMYTPAMHWEAAVEAGEAVVVPLGQPLQASMEKAPVALE